MIDLMTLKKGWGTCVYGIGDLDINELKENHPKHPTLINLLHLKEIDAIYFCRNIALTRFASHLEGFLKKDTLFRFNIHGEKTEYLKLFEFIKGFNNMGYGNNTYLKNILEHNEVFDKMKQKRFFDNIIDRGCNICKNCDNYQSF